MKIRYAGSTHVGMKRAHNEDSFLLLGEHNLYVVADGMGGHASGEVASQIAVETLGHFFIDTSRDTDMTWPFKANKAQSYDENRLNTGIKLANRRVFESAQSEAKLRGMGTTLVSLYCGKTGVYVAHVGDSRVYRITEGRIVQMTEDHSLLNDYLKMHTLTPEEIAAFPHKNVIVRALGMRDSVAVDIQKTIPKKGDYFMLCSDGLSGMIDDATILQAIQEAQDDVEKMCQSLIAAANARGGQDNITVVVVGFS